MENVEGAQAPACLVLHGFTGGPFEVEPLAKELEEAGYHTLVPTLPGHGGSLDQLRHVTYRDWLEAVDEYSRELQKQHGYFDVVGFSMGGYLAAYASNRYPVRKLVLLSAALIYISPKRFMNMLALMIRDGDWSHIQKSKDTPLKATFQFVRLARSLRSEFRKIQVPTLILQGDKDPIVHPRSAHILHRIIDAPRELEFFPESQHLLCLDDEAELVIERVKQFLMKA